MQSSDFEKLGIDEDFNPFYQEEEIKTPNELQLKVIPKLIEGKSVICVSQTGTGKTLSYALPISELIKRIEDDQGLSEKKTSPYGVIVAPTKELAIQIHHVFKKISHHVKLRVRTLVGNKTSSLKNQNYEILIATPAKLARAVRDKEVSFCQLKYLVFDEADQLFDMGFKKNLEAIIYHVDYDSTDIHFFSATMPPEASDFINQKFKKKSLEQIELTSAHRVQQKIETFNIYLSPKEKNIALKELLAKTVSGRGMVFVNQRNQMEEIDKFISEKLPKLKYKVLHGALSEKERLSVHKAFMDKKLQLLICSDVMARGIDVKDLNWVINYGLPKTPIYYLHRCGRTGRAGRSGVVYNLVTHYDSKLIGLINDAIKQQSHLDIKFIAKDMQETRKKAAKKSAKKVKSKRVKITKRSKLGKR